LVESATIRRSEMQRVGKSYSLPMPRVGRDVVVVDAVKTRDGWMAFAVTSKGLLATRIARRTKQEALRLLEKERRLRRLKTEQAPADVAVPWGALLKDAFEGKRVDLSSVPLDERDWTPFQKRVYRHARKIPYGKVKSYGEVAKAASSPRAARAVGQMMARNPVAPIVPCHRVVGSDGSLCGFSGIGGIRLKAAMLKREGARD
jgi:methylated-DNA-[protein]-cysteine S-methyltransferase